jgi:hypothetical protein
MTFALKNPKAASDAGRPVGQSGMGNPYLLDRPASIALSGGRSSAFMLRKIIDAFGGTLPDDVRPFFGNTGKEDESALKFLRDIERHWSVVVTMLEYRPGFTFEVVNYDTASREGQPFEAICRDRGYLPNRINRFCSSELKFRTTYRYVTEVLGWESYTSAIGFRADEPGRVAKLKGDRAAEDCVAPMYRAGHSIRDVRAFWRAQPFDLELPENWDGWGNCDGCFLKSQWKLERIATLQPERLEWWAKQEATLFSPEQEHRTFRTLDDRPPYRELIATGRRLAGQGKLPFGTVGDEDTCHCTD